ncbi:MAG: M48 family metallopeptidase [Tannerella sp.]|jgi:predicted Zn-dependent protease|nr:M48 family metallopeptidase [Tannerella sp.]
MKKISLFIALLFFFTSCGTVPLTGRRQMLLISDTELITASLTQYDTYIKSTTLSTDKAKTATVERVGKKISEATETYLRQNGFESELANFQWEFKLVKENQVNAFCMPGGKIVVFEGLLPLIASDDELAVVIGHEVAHAVAKHSNERMSQEVLTQYGAAIVDAALSTRTSAIQSLGNTVFGLGAQLGVMLPYSRQHEYEADYIGMIFMTLAGYNPESTITFWQKMSGGGSGGGSDFLSTHPSDDKRIAELQRRMPEMSKFKK